MSRVEGWTDPRYWSFIRSLLRRGFSKYPNKFRVLALSKGGRNEYTCASCNEVYGKKDVAVDHIVPCGSLKSNEDIAEFVDKMFCPLDGLQVLCSTCHTRKTLLERGLTELDIAVLWFRKLKAGGQKKWLKNMKVEPAKNEAGRIEQYKETL